jgi:hypothetical protein
MWEIASANLMRARYVVVAGALSLLVLSGGCGAGGRHAESGGTTPVPSTPSVEQITTAGQQPTTRSEVVTVLRQKLHLFKLVGSDAFTLRSGNCALNGVYTGSDALIYGANDYTAVSPDHSAVVIVEKITSGGGAPAFDCVQAIKKALGWS